MTCMTCAFAFGVDASPAIRGPDDKADSTAAPLFA